MAVSYISIHLCVTAGRNWRRACENRIPSQVPDEAELKVLAGSLEKEGLHFKLWMEQPEGFPTCLATKPYPKSLVQKHFKKLRLFK